MGYLVSYLFKFWRRKSTLLGVAVLLFVFLLCLQLAANNNDHPNRVPLQPDGKLRDFDLAPGAAAFVAAKSGRKRLQAAPNNAEGASYEPSRHDVFDPVNRGVQFIPGVPGHKLDVDAEAQENAERLQFLKVRNQQLFQNEAKVAQQAKEKILGAKKKHRGDLQPSSDDNFEYKMDPEMQAPVFSQNGVPVYRGDTYNRPFAPADDEVSSSPRPAYVPKQRLIHFDLKGAPPKLDYLIKILKLAKVLGATGVLMEYEDMFPFEGTLKAVAAKNHYSKEEITKLLDTCDQLGLEVIPLVQTFGHMEFILKHKQFAHLRDNSEMPESICPCHHEAMILIKEYIRQVMALHKHVNYVHIGCDEVFHLGECEPCQGSTRTSTFVSHVTTVAKHVRSTFGKRVIIWDDMLRNFMPVEMEPLAEWVEPMVWVYAEDVYRFMPTFTWDRYADVFPTAWTASAFKGAHGPTLTVPNVKRHLDNNLNWLDLMGQEESKFKGGFQGLVITGWQRYDHFAVLCELLPVGVPSMAVDLLAAHHGTFNASHQDELLKALDCVGTHRALDEPLDFDMDPYMYDKMSWCYFPGASVFKLARSLETTQGDVAAFMKKATAEQAWLTPYSQRRNYSTPFRINEGLEEWGIVYSSVTNLMRSAKTALSEVFDEFTTAEWIEQKIYPMYKELVELRSSAEGMKARKTWPSRPLKPLAELAEFGIGLPEPKPTEAKEGELTNEVIGQNSDGQVVHKRLVQQPDYYRHPPGS